MWERSSIDGEWIVCVCHKIHICMHTPILHMTQHSSKASILCANQRNVWAFTDIPTVMHTATHCQSFQHKLPHICSALTWMPGATSDGTVIPKLRSSISRDWLFTKWLVVIFVTTITTTSPRPVFLVQQHAYCAYLLLQTLRKKCSVQKNTNHR